MKKFRLSVIVIACISLFMGAFQAVAYEVYRQRFVLTVYSMNGDYYAKSSPYSAVKESRLGKTEVFETRSHKLLYTIPACLTEGILWLSNDGNILTYTICDDTHYENECGRAVTIYHHGILYKELSIEDFVGKDSYPLYYTLQTYFFNDQNQTADIPKELLEKPYYISEDTLFLISTEQRILKLKMSTGEFEFAPMADFPLDRFLEWQPPVTQKIIFQCPDSFIFKLENGKKISEELASKLNMGLVGIDERDSKYKTYRLFFDMMLDFEGKCSIVELKNPDLLPENKVRELMSTVKFSVDAVPNEVDKWHYKSSAFFRKRNLSLAQRERRQELKKEHEEYLHRLKADSINGVYIPKDIEDAFNTLDSLLDSKTIQHILSFNDRSEMVSLHLNLGMWIRNNWGLWMGSRFQQCLIEKFGRIHPDDLSGKFLELYYDHLKNR